MLEFLSTKIFLLKDMSEVGQKKFLLLVKLKILFCDYVISDMNDEEIIGTFYEKEFQETNQEEFRIKKVIKRKGNKLYVKWKGYDSSFNGWIDNKDII